jgi:hypothetical protein
MVSRDNLPPDNNGNVEAIERNSNEIETIICEPDLSVLMECWEEADNLVEEHKTDHDFGRSQ